MSCTQILWNVEIDNIKNSGYLTTGTNITDALIENFFNNIMGEEEKLLIKLVCTFKPSQEELNELLKLWDIEVKQSTKSLLLAYLTKTNPELNFTEYEGPRLKGLLMNIRFKNLQHISHYSKIVKELNHNNITPVIIKNGAYRHLRPEFPRIANCFEIIVPEKVLEKSVKIAKQLGYHSKKTPYNSVVLYETNSTETPVLEIYPYFYTCTGKERRFNNGLFKRANEQDVFGVKTLVPSLEDLMFMTLVNISNDLRNTKSNANLLFDLYDCKFILDSKADFSWDIVKENAIKTNTKVHINFAIKFINKISKNILPQDLQNNILFEKETNDYSRMIMFKKFYYTDLQKQCREMKLGKIIKKPSSWGKYVSMKTKYKTLKSIKNHPRLIEWFIKDINKTYKNTK